MRHSLKNFEYYYADPQEFDATIVALARKFVEAIAEPDFIPASVGIVGGEVFIDWVAGKERMCVEICTDDCVPGKICFVYHTSPYVKIENDFYSFDEATIIVKELLQGITERLNEINPNWRELY